MKIALVNTKLPGGAHKAFLRLTHALQQAGVDATMVEIERKWWNFLWERLCIFISNHFSKKNLFAVSIANTGVNIAKLKAVQEADIIHLHWINQGGLSLRNIAQLQPLGKPIVWTCHDMWPFTGICHHANECTQFQSLCVNCAKANACLAKSIFDKKQVLYKNITFIGCSQWISQLARESALTQTSFVEQIPNPIDTNIYHPQDRTILRNRYHLPQDKKLILFGAMNIADQQKGALYLLSADKLLGDQIAYIAIGAKGGDILNKLKHSVYSLGYITDDKMMSEIYAMADVFVTPSLAENLPNMIMEAMACGTPCVGFHVGGVPEMINHKINGYVAKYKDPQDLADGVAWCLDHQKELTGKAVDKVIKTYSEPVVANQFIQLYNSLLTKK